MSWRLLPLEKPTDFLWNMAVDEFLLNRSIQNEASAIQPVLRFYQWDKSALSVGYFQKIENVVKEHDCERKQLRVVRRETGGGIVPHGKDLTMSISLPEKNDYFSLGVSDSYRDIHAIILEALQPRFPKLTWSESGKSLRPRGERQCFEEPTTHDLMLNNQKILGSSQRRRGGMLLHQTALFIDIPASDAAKVIHEAFKRKLKANFDVQSLLNEEKNVIEKLVKEKYAQPEHSFAPEAH